MKILFVSALLPYPLYSGGQVRIYNLLKILSKKHEISLFSFIRDESERRYLSEINFCKKNEVVLRGHAWQPKYVTAAIFGKYPLLLSSYDNGEMKRKIDEEIHKEKYDLIHIEPGYVCPSLPETELPIVVAEHNVESTIYEDYVKKFPIPPLRGFLYTDVLKLKFWEKKIWRKSRGIVTVSEDDIQVISPSLNGQKKAVVPNGVDPKAFPFKPKNDVGKDLIFLFVGNFSWIQNRDALKYLLTNLWPEIRNIYPESSLRIIGRQMPDNLHNLVIKNKATLLEDISDISSEYQKADIMLAPIRIGGGTKFKILEALASGLPVISSSKGIQGLDIAAGQEIMIADDSPGTVKAVSELLNSEKRKKIVAAARNKIEKKYTWQQISSKLENLWLEVLNA